MQIVVPDHFLQKVFPNFFGRLSLRIINLQIIDHLFCYCRFGSLFQRVVPVYFAHSHSKSHFACCRSEVFFCKILFLI